MTAVAGVRVIPKAFAASGSAIVLCSLSRIVGESAATSARICLASSAVWPSSPGRTSPPVAGAKNSRVTSSRRSWARRVRTNAASCSCKKGILDDHPPGTCYDYYNSGVTLHIPSRRHGGCGPRRKRVSEPFALDFAVLEHLRGYPEELHRYANLMKQTHPRGMSAVEFLLRRAGAQDGFLETICRMVKGGETAVTAVEAGRPARGPPRAIPGGRAARARFSGPVFPPWPP